MHLLGPNRLSICWLALLPACLLPTAPAIAPAPACCADSALVVSGQHYDGWLSRMLWLYNATEDSWARVGHAPVYIRDHVCGLPNGRLFMALGRQGAGKRARIIGQMSGQSCTCMHLLHTHGTRPH